MSKFILVLGVVVLSLIFYGSLVNNWAQTSCHLRSRVFKHAQQLLQPCQLQQTQQHYPHQWQQRERTTLHFIFKKVLMDPIKMLKWLIGSDQKYVVVKDSKNSLLDNLNHVLHQQGIVLTDIASDPFDCKGEYLYYYVNVMKYPSKSAARVKEREPNMDLSKFNNVVGFNKVFFDDDLDLNASPYDRNCPVVGIKYTPSF